MPFISDVRHALRSLLRRPGFTVIGAAMLALGIGANTAMFSAVFHTLIRPLPFSERASWRTSTRPRKTVDS